MKPKVTLFVNGNIFCREDFGTTTQTNLDNGYFLAKPDDFDLSEAIIVEGNLICDNMDIKSHIVACTGDIVSFNGEMPLSLKMSDKEIELVKSLFGKHLFKEDE